VGTLRGELGRHPHDADLQELVAELTSPEFVRRWDDHTVRRYRSGKAGFRTNGSDEVIELDYEALDVVSDPGLTVLVYSAEPGTQAAARLASLV